MPSIVPNLSPDGAPTFPSVFVLNHMTLAGASYEAVLECASALGCSGIEVRNDLGGTLFDGQSAHAAGAAAAARGLRLFALAEVCEFDKYSSQKLDEAAALITLAVDAGCSAISLIPRNDGQLASDGERQDNLRQALRALKPLLESNSMTGLIEPLGFESCSLRSKAEAVQAIEDVSGKQCFKLIHDTFHHHLAGGGPVFASHTGMVHISGITDTALSLSDMRDEHRVLVDEHDVLGNMEQLQALASDGYTGPVSFEAFSPEVHAFTDPIKHLRGSINFIASTMAAVAA